MEVDFNFDGFCNILNRNCLVVLFESVILFFRNLVFIVYRAMPHLNKLILDSF